MSYFYSPSAGGFFLEGLHEVMPDDCLPLTDEEYNALMQGQSEGKTIVYKARKVQLETPKPTVPTWERIREVRDQKLAECDWTQMSDSPLDEATRDAWKVYRQKLRDITETYAEAKDVIWPVAPVSSR